MKPIRWVGDSLEKLQTFPNKVKREIGYALHFAQMGDKHPSAKPLQGFGGGQVLEIVESHDGNAWRAKYTVRFAGVVYVLHAFQKKSKRGIKTPKHVLELIKERLQVAEADFRSRAGGSS